MGTFGWCNDDAHDQCPHSYEVFFIDNKRKVVYTGETRVCQCSKRGCKCYVKAVDRDKKTKRKKRVS